MTKEEKNQCTEKLKNLIKKLASNNIKNEERPNLVKELKNIYHTSNCDENTSTTDEEYRHEYFRVSETIYEINGDNSMSFEMLLYNLNGLLEYVEEENEKNKKEKDFLRNLIKLNDHINLEIARILRATKDYRELNKLSTTVCNSVEQTNETLKKIEDLKQSIDTSTTNQITILSIFTGIVMAFVGGFSILGSAFSNTQLFETRIWLLIFLMSLVGFIFFNTVFMFIYTVAKLSGKKISVQCKDTECTKCIQCGECKRLKVFCPFCRLGRKYPYVAYINVILLIIMIAAVVWCIITSCIINMQPNELSTSALAVDTQEDVSAPDINFHTPEGYLQKGEETEMLLKDNPTTGR